MYHEHNDGDSPVVENQPVSETLASPSPFVDDSPVEGTVDNSHEQSEGSVPQNEEHSPTPATNIEGGELQESQTQQPEERGEDEVLPFTAFIKEFQQSEGYPAVPQQEPPAGTFAALISEVVPSSETVMEFSAAGLGTSWQPAIASEAENMPQPVTGICFDIPG
jgi:hypothetical protein